MTSGDARVRPALIIIFLASLVAGAPAHADTAPRLSSLVVPGGRSTLRLADVPGDVPRALVLPLLVRLLHADPPGSTREQDERLEALRARLDRIGRLQQALATVGDRRVSLVGAADEQSQSRVARAIEAMGLRLQRSGAVPRVEADTAPDAVAQREALADAGLEVPSIVARLNAGEPVQPQLASLTLPLPLDEAAWISSVLRRTVPPEELFGAIVTDRGAALLLHGLLGMEPGARAWLGAHPAVLRQAARRSAVLCAFGRSMRFEGDRLELPGGAEASPAWERLAGGPPSDTARFMTELLVRDEGRLAYFLDVVAHLGPAMQRAVLGLPPGPAPVNTDAVAETYQVFLESTGAWLQNDRPFLLPVFDAALLLDELAVLPSGRTAGPRWRRFWDRALGDSSLPADPSTVLHSLEDDGEITPASFIRLTMVPNLDERRARFEMVRFVQRIAPDPDDRSLADLLVAARGFGRFPALMQELERIGATDPAVLAVAARRAMAIDGIGDGAKRNDALAELQGALSLVDGAAAARFLAQAELRRLTASLVAVPLSGDGYAGAVARWIDTEWLPALAGAEHGDDARDGERLVLRSWSGPPVAGADPALAWEGRLYTVDPVAAELQRLSALREAQGSSGLSEVLALWRATAAIASASSADEARLALPALEQAAATPPPVRRVTPGARALADDVSRAAAEIRRMKKPKDLRNVPKALAPVRAHVDRALAGALLSLAYTRHLGDPDTSVLDGDPAARHEFGRPGTPSAAWTRPREVGDETGRHMSGALLGLDLALARLSLRRLSTGAVPPAPSMNENAIDLVRETVVLSARQPPSERDVALAADALRRGRERLEAARTDAGALDELSGEARLSEWRRFALPWAMVEVPAEITPLFSQGELFRLGSGGDMPAVFGASASEIDGCWCLRAPRARPWEDVAARPAIPRVAAQSPDLALRLAELVYDMRVPASVYPALLALAAPEFIDRAATRFPEDWPALVAAASALSRDRAEDYVSGLVGGGPLRMRQEPGR